MTIHKKALKRAVWRTLKEIAILVVGCITVATLFIWVISLAENHPLGALAVFVGLAGTTIFGISLATNYSLEKIRNPDRWEDK